MEELADRFAELAALLGDRSRAKILWCLLDGKAYTAGELATVSELSLSGCSNHLRKLLEAKVLKVIPQGRHRYYSLYDGEVAHAMEAFASLVGAPIQLKERRSSTPVTLRKARSCYKHLAGGLGVAIFKAFQDKGYVETVLDEVYVSELGLRFLVAQGICKESEPGLTAKLKLCLDWSERELHLGGWLGIHLLRWLLQEDWLRPSSASRKLTVSAKGKKHFNEVLGIDTDEL